MYFLKRLTVLIVVAAIAAIWFTPSIVHAQGGTPAATCDASFGAEGGAVFQAASQAMNSGSGSPSSIGPVTLPLIKFRQQYEDVTAPAGCEATRSALVKIAGLDEDVVFVLIAAQLDTKNVTNYTDFIKKSWQPRFDAFKTSMAATAAPNPTATSASTTAAACTDSKFQSQVMDDLKNVPSGADATAANWGTAGLVAINMRYKYEDMTVPAGCERARTDLAQLLFVVEDQSLAALAQLGDTANAAAYGDFIKTTVGDRAGKLYTKLTTDLGPTATPAK